MENEITYVLKMRSNGAWIVSKDTARRNYSLARHFDGINELFDWLETTDWDRKGLEIHEVTSSFKHIG